jgi:hypothetical protein
MLPCTYTIICSCNNVIILQLLVKIPFAYTKYAGVAFNTCCSSLSVGCEKLSFGFGFGEVTVASQADSCAEESLTVRAIKDGG